MALVLLVDDGAYRTSARASRTRYEQLPGDDIIGHSIPIQWERGAAERSASEAATSTARAVRPTPRRSRSSVRGGVRRAAARGRAPAIAGVRRGRPGGGARAPGAPGHRVAMGVDPARRGVHVGAVV